MRTPGFFLRHKAASLDKMKQSAIRELKLFGVLLGLGLLLLPSVIYLVGNFVFGEYGGSGLIGFYGTLLGSVAIAEPVVVFLVLSPYLVWQLARLTMWGFRRASQ